MADDGYPTPDVPVESVSPRDLKAMIDRGDPVTILDVRTESEYEQWHIDGPSVTVENIAYYDFLEADDDLLDRVPQADPLVVICAKGSASEYVAGVLKEQRGMNAVNLAEGMNGWAGIYEAHEVTRYDGAGVVVQYQRPSSGCLGYMVVSGDEAAVIDPLRAFTDRYLADAADCGAELAYAIDTHVHADHVSGVRNLAAEGVEAVMPAEAVPRGIDYDVDYETVGDGDRLAVGEATIEAVHTPGHTSGMTSYLVDDSVLLTGDGLFVESVARPDLEKGDEGAPDAARQLHETFQERILPLPDETIIAPGHFSDAADPSEDGTYTARLGALRESMKVLGMDVEDFVSRILADMPPRPANFEDIIATNLGTKETDDDEAFRLELGPNNCAATQDAIGDD